MQQKTGRLSAFASLITVVMAVVVMLIDKPDYHFFNFLRRNLVPAAETIGRGISYPFRLVGRFAEGIRESNNVLSDNASVRQKISEFDNIAAENEVLRRENENLRARLNMTAAIKHKTIAAEIIHNLGFAGRQNFIIKNDSPEIKPGNAVISIGGQMIGIVAEKIGGFARIQSLRDGKSNIPVKIAGTGVFGFLQGGGPRRDPELSFLSDGDYMPEAGQLLITSGVAGNLPSDIPVGRIRRAGGGDIMVSPGAEMKNLESVVIILFDKENRYE